MLGNETFLTEDDVDAGIKAVLDSVQLPHPVVVAHADIYLGMIAGHNAGHELDTDVRGPTGTLTHERLRTTIPPDITGKTIAFPICLETLPVFDDAGNVVHEAHPWHWTLGWVQCVTVLNFGEVQYCDTYGSDNVRRGNIPASLVNRIVECLQYHSSTAHVRTRESPTCHFGGQMQHESECGVCVIEGVRRLALGQSVSGDQPPRGQARADLAARLLGSRTV